MSDYSVTVYLIDIFNTDNEKFIFKDHKTDSYGLREIILQYTAFDPDELSKLFLAINDSHAWEHTYQPNARDGKANHIRVVKVHDPMEETMPTTNYSFSVSIFDVRSEVFLFEDAKMGDLGMTDILQKYTNMDVLGRRWFMNTLVREGVCKHRSGLPDGSEFDIRAVKIGKNHQPMVWCDQTHEYVPEPKPSLISVTVFDDRINDYIFKNALLEIDEVANLYKSMINSSEASFNSFTMDLLRFSFPAKRDSEDRRYHISAQKAGDK